MSSAAIPLPEPGWDDEGRRLSPLIDTLSAVVIVGSDTNAATLVALGLGRAQAERRRVVIGDLVGDLEPLESMVPRHDHHGLSDSFNYGISLNKVGYPVEEGGNLYIMPSGSEPVATEPILGNPRWQRLVAGFRQVDALLLLVAERTAPGLERLIPMTDGALLVGDTRLEAPSHVIARARPRGPRRMPTAEGERPALTSIPPALPPVASSPATAAPLAMQRAATARHATADDTPVESGRRIGLLVALPLGLVALLLVSLLIARYAGFGRPNETAAPVVAPLAPLSPDAAPAADPPPPVENPRDSTTAAAFAVVIVAANTSAGADANLQRVIDLPAATAAPSIDGGSLWYKVFVGAFADRADAEAFRDSLRASGRADETVARIAALPFAFLVAEAVAADSIQPLRASYLEKGVSTYALVQPDGAARMFAGAFATPEEAMHLAPVLRAAGIQPRIVYRTGRSY